MVTIQPQPQPLRLELDDIRFENFPFITCLPPSSQRVTFPTTYYDILAIYDLFLFGYFHVSTRISLQGCICITT